MINCYCSAITFYRNQNRGICPVCRSNFDPSRVIPLHSLDNDSESNTVGKIYNYVKVLENRDTETKSSLEYIVNSVNILTASLADLKQDNVELKAKISKIEAEGVGGSSTAGEQLRLKDTIIAGLRKEVQDLKSQRAATANQMLDIQEQISELKKNAIANKEDRAPFKNTTNENQQPKPITLSLKFDDISDRLILGDF